MLQGSYGWMNMDYAANAINYDVKSWNVVAAASWTIFDGFSTQSKIKEAQANLESAASNRSLVKKTVELDVKQAYLNYVLSKDILDTAQKAADSACENYDIADARYKNGLGTNIELLDAETALTKAQLDLLSVKFDIEIAKAQIAKAAGISDLKAVGDLMKKVVLEGAVKFVDLEGGFIGFIDNAGNKYDLSGSRADEILKTIGKSGEEKKIKISGYPKENVVTIHMWGKPFEIENYEWK
jgi:hypothetical protein